MRTFTARHSALLRVTANTVMFVSLPLLGEVTSTAFGHPSNVGNISYAVVIYGLSLRYLLNGIAEGPSAIGAIVFALSIIIGSVFILQDAHLSGPAGWLTMAILALVSVPCLAVDLWLVRRHARSVTGQASPRHRRS